MPLHDWTDRKGWDGVHHLWISELLRWIKPRLPAEYRAYIGTAPTVAIDAVEGTPDVGVHRSPEGPQANGVMANGAPTSAEEPDVEIAVATIDPATSLFVESAGRLIAALELISPRNKDRPTARANYTARYVGYLLSGVHLLLVDVHRRPAGFSFSTALAAELQARLTSGPAPLAAAYRVGEKAATGGRYVAVWHRALEPDQPLPAMLLPLTVERSVPVDLETTYMRAASDAYLP
jgi:hypothetical protein